MATHRISLPHLTHRDPGQSLAGGQTSTHPEANFWLFMLAPVVIAFTTLAISLISRQSFGG